MPHVELKYTDDISLNVEGLLVNLEAAINEIDPSAGVCKSRAYKATCFLQTHFFMNVSVLRKTHRDNKFMQTLLQKLEGIVTPELPKDCYYSIELDFVSDYYITSKTANPG